MDGGDEFQLLVDLVKMASLVAEAEQFQGTVSAAFVHLTKLVSMSKNYQRKQARRLHTQYVHVHVHCITNL